MIAQILKHRSPGYAAAGNWSAAAMASCFLMFSCVLLKADEVRFNRDIRPILSDTCFKCHGFDRKARQADLRLDVADEAFKARKHGIPIVPGHPESSQAYLRLISTDPDLQMPPPQSHLKLTAEQMQMIRKWIEQGAVYQPHWAFIPPRDPPLPEVKNTTWPKNPVDRFVLARLEEEGLSPSPEADRRTLLRQLTLDLTGLPPTPSEVSAYLADSSADAYEKQVDRLLASPRYGERMALEWLDAARYADSNGYQADPTRTMWPWRDWVIKAMNENMPFDQFTIEQLAGDLLPNATFEQRLASGFNRNHPYNSEGGAIAEEVRVTNVLDRVDTTSTTFLGLTVGCAKCHDHKYDPITQKDYYSLYAYFNQCSETGGNVGYSGTGDAAPTIIDGSPEQLAQLALLRQKQKDAEAQLAAALPAIDAGESEWEKSAVRPVEFYSVAPSSVTSDRGASMRILGDDSVLVEGANPETDVHHVVLKTGIVGTRAIQLEVLPDPSLPHDGPGRAIEDGNFVLTQIGGQAVSEVDPKKTVPLKFVSAVATFAQDGFPVADLLKAGENSGWAVAGAPDKNHLSATFNLAHPVGFAGGTEFHLDLHYTSEHAKHTLGHFRLSLATVGVVPPELLQSLAIEKSKRDAAQKKALRAYYRDSVNGRSVALTSKVMAAKKVADDLERSIPHVMVMDDATPRKSHVLFRGQYDKPLDDVSAATPAVLPPLPKDAPHNRLALAKWLVDPANPLTARVIVNRYWQTFFGTGIVKTSDDFGTQGEPPSHPELLDYLAYRFMTTGWDVKAMQRLIVTSATYRQSSKITPELLEKDPANRLLARGARFRLPSFLIRDQALAASGLLVEKLGGPPVKPYQPPGVWEDMSLGKITYEQDHGESLYRRSIYTFWRRTVSPTSMFDVSPRTTCVVRPSRTNTPLQALTLENDPTYVEAARVLSQQLLEGNATPRQTFNDLFERLLARDATEIEAGILSAALDRLQSEYRADPASALQLLSVGESPRDPHIDSVKLASWTALVSTVMNMDEVITKQ
jgi:hypothetical protein